MLLFRKANLNINYWCNNIIITHVVTVNRVAIWSLQRPTLLASCLPRESTAFLFL